MAAVVLTSAPATDGTLTAGATPAEIGRLRIGNVLDDEVTAAVALCPRAERFALLEDRLVWFGEAPAPDLEPAETLTAAEPCRPAPAATETPCDVPGDWLEGALTPAEAFVSPVPVETLTPADGPCCEEFAEAEALAEACTGGFPPDADGCACPDAEAFTLGLEPVCAEADTPALPPFGADADTFALAPPPDADTFAFAPPPDDSDTPTLPVAPPAETDAFTPEAPALDVLDLDAGVVVPDAVKDFVVVAAAPVLDCTTPDVVDVTPPTPRASALSAAARGAARPRQSTPLSVEIRATDASQGILARALQGPLFVLMTATLLGPACFISAPVNMQHP